MGTPKIIIRNICDVNSFLKILHFYLTLKNGGSKHDFFVLLNVPVGVHERLENLLNCIGIRDLSFCDEFFVTFYQNFYEIPIFENEKLGAVIIYPYINYILKDY